MNAADLFVLLTSITELTKLATDHYGKLDAADQAKLAEMIAVKEDEFDGLMEKIKRE